MRCAEVSSNLAAFVSGGMEPEDAADIERHLASCPACREEREELEWVHRALQAAPPPEHPPDRLKEEVLSQVRARERPLPDEVVSRTGRNRSEYLRPLIAAVAAAAVAVIVAVGIVPDLLEEPPAATVRLVPTPEEAAELEDYWGVAELYPQSLGNLQVALRLNNFGESEPNTYYEVWFVSRGEHVSAGSFTSSGDGEIRVRLNVASQARDSHTLLITEEHADDNPAPSDYVALKGELP